jgi:flagellar motor switch protein FliM
MEPLTGQALLGIGHEITTCVIDRMLGGVGLSQALPRELTDIEQSLMNRVLERTLGCLQEAWQTVLPVQVSKLGMESSYTMIQIASPGEIVALVTLQVTMNNRDMGLMSLCLPYPLLETVINQLSAQHIFHRQNENLSDTEKQQILQKLHYAKIPVEVFLAGTTISVQDLLELNVGDVIRLDRSAAQDVLINVNHRPKFYGRPGRLKDKLALYVTDAIENEETLEGFGF